MDMSTQAEVAAANHPLNWHKLQWQVHYEHAICMTDTDCDL